MQTQPLLAAKSRDGLKAVPYIIRGLLKAVPYMSRNQEQQTRQGVRF